jgi:hypothetical protein
LALDQLTGLGLAQPNGFGFNLFLGLKLSIRACWPMRHMPCFKNIVVGQLSVG